MSKEIEDTKEKTGTLKPFLIGFLVMGIVIIPICVSAAILLPQDVRQTIPLLKTVKLGQWVMVGFLFGALITSLLSLLFARRVSPSRISE